MFNRSRIFFLYIHPNGKKKVKQQQENQIEPTCNVFFIDGNIIKIICNIMGNVIEQK